ncbi:hypothetical protein NLJ89_g2277 [Agrocybe chaxingu]|uniref:C3H1-type domain-containing protein n=1 Tax=Agrocybe chaxingu TaxID=84603 RepID=A0A9W8KCF4_9AGAR|nr:hypothetical protein NLJ89_g2277 [Agrocybe chaxingu]
MHTTATIQTTATPAFKDDLFAPVSRPPAIKDALGWFYPADDDPDPSFDHWNFSAPDTAVHLSTLHRPFPTFQKISTTMPPRSTDFNDRSVPNGRRWMVNGSGQYIDSGAEANSWGLADEMGRMKIGDVTDTDEARVPIHTPPKSKLAAAAVAQINESSPLDSSSSSTSVGSSPHVPDHQISHSRGSSADTTLSSSRDSITGNALLSHPPLKNAPAEAKERPHSFSGGLSSADLRRLQQVGDADHDRQLQQQQQWAQNQYRDPNSEQLSYPSLATQIHQPNELDREEPQLEYNNPQQQRSFAPVPPHLNHAQAMPPMNPATPPQFVQSRPTNVIPTMNYRQTPRNFVPPQGPTPTLGYNGGHHTSHLSLGNTQQLYEMMLPLPHDSHHPAVTRVQQQHNVFRATHHHSASDPSAIRDVAALALLNNSMQGFATPNMFQPGIPPAMQLYANQYYSAQDIAVQQAAMAARLQAQYTGPYGVAAAATPALPLDGGIASPTSSSGQPGPSANNRKLGLYKTELCRSWEEKGSCRYGAKCQFAHGEDELRKVSRHPKYKTEICKTFWVSGSCPYGKRCCFIHTELSTATTPGTGSSDNAPPQPQVDGRERSNSDPDASSTVSLLTRISQRNQQQETPGSSAATPVDMSSTNGFPFTRPPTGSLRVDTSALDGASIKQNKSAYPSFASNGILLPATDHIATKSPAPVTAGPDLGRQHLARMEIVGYPNHQKKNSSSSTSNANPRHSFSGSDGDLSFSPSPPATGHSYGLSSAGETSTSQPTPTRVNGHVRAGSAGNWASFSRNSHLSTSTSAYPHGPSPAGEIMSNSPWSSTELAVGSSRLHEKAWA